MNKEKTKKDKARKNYNKTIKDFKAVEWVRNVRDKMYEETKNMNREEFRKYISERAEKSGLTKGMKKRSL